MEGRDSFNSHRSSRSSWSADSWQPSKGSLLDPEFRKSGDVYDAQTHAEIQLVEREHKERQQAKRYHRNEYGDAGGDDGPILLVPDVLSRAPARAEVKRFSSYWSLRKNR